MLEEKKEETLALETEVDRYSASKRSNRTSCFVFWLFFLPLLWAKKVTFFVFFYGPLFCVKKVQAFPVLSSLQQKKKNDNVVQVTGGDTVIEDDLTADLFDIRGVSNTNMYKSEE